jgi:hypothetical protein
MNLGAFLDKNIWVEPIQSKESTIDILSSQSIPKNVLNLISEYMEKTTKFELDVIYVTKVQHLDSE